MHAAVDTQASSCRPAYLAVQAETESKKAYMQSISM